MRLIKIQVIAEAQVDAGRSGQLQRPVSSCVNYVCQDDTNLHDNLANRCSISSDIEENTGGHLEWFGVISEICRSR